MKLRRHVLALGVVVAVGVLGPAGVAHAQESEPSSGETMEFADTAAEECYQLLAEGKKIEDCQEAPSPIVPEVNEIIWGGLFFLIVAFLLGKFAFPALKAGMRQREDKIRGDLEAAESSRAASEAELEEYRRRLADARNEAAQIVEESRQAGEQVRRDVIARAEQEAVELRARSLEDVRLATERAMAELRGRVGAMSIDLAEKIVERNLDRDTQMALIESYIDQVGSN